MESAQAGACASSRSYLPGFAAEAGATLPVNGGVLFMPILVSDSPGSDATESAPEESLRRGARPLESERIELAPGWFVLRPRRATTGAIQASTGSGERRFTLRGRGRATLDAPVEPRLRFYAAREAQGSRGATMASEYNSLALGAPPPAGAYAVVVRHVAAEGSAPGADGFALPVNAPEQRSFTFTPRGGRCEPDHPGAAVQPGAEVEVFYVDVAGRMSEPVVTSVR